MSSLFPLPLTTIERFFVQDDQPGYPNHVVCRLRCSGKLDRERMVRAMWDVYPRQPLTGVRLDRSGRIWKWIHDDSTLPPLQRQEVDDPDAYPPLPPIDLEEGPSMRIIEVPRGDDTDLVLQIHHACMDGIGGLQAIGELMYTYHHLASGDSFRRPKVDVSLLRRRGKFINGIRDWLRKMPRQAIGLYGAYKYMTHRAVPLCERAAEPLERKPFSPRVLTHLFTPEQSTRFQRLADEGNATVNGVLARDLFLSVRDWLAKQPTEYPGNYVRLMVPLNMRTIADRRLPATNRVSMVYLDRTEKDFRDPAGLLWGINFEIKTIQKWNLGLTWLMFARLIQKIPGGMRREVQADICRSTCVFTNLGDPFGRIRVPKEDGRLRFGDLILNSFDLLAPLRPRTGAAVSVFRYAGRTGFTLHYDPWTVEKEDAQSLLDLFVARALESIG